MIIASNNGGLAATNSYLIADEASKQAVLFDAPNDTVAPLLDEVSNRGLNLVGLWLTHGHWDHLADHRVVKDRFPDAKILIHTLDVPMLRKPGSVVFRLPFTIPPGEPDEVIEDNQLLHFGPFDVKVMHTPGHCPGHVCYWFEAQKVLVGGDLIIGGAIGRTDLPGADPRAMMNSLRRVMALPDDTRLLPGHGGPSTLGIERANNPYVQMALQGATLDD